LENHGSKEATDTSKYSIEHIMPQNQKLSSDWRKMLGENWREIQREWLHRLGNLTLTGYNSSYSDRSFSEKRTIKGGFEESSVRLNKYVREQPVWTPAEMERRGKSLATRALTVWPPLVVDQVLIDSAREAEMRQLSKQKDTRTVPMSEGARTLFNQLQMKVLDIDANIIELAEQKSVSYHGPGFFLEVLPRKNRITLLLDLDFNEVDDPQDIAKDASEYKFLVNAVYDGGVIISVWDVNDIEKSLPLIRQAWERS
jgi:predicted transport protein